MSLITEEKNTVAHALQTVCTTLRGSQLVSGIQYATAFYDFADDGGAIATDINKYFSQPIPSGSAIIEYFTDVTTTLTTGSTTAVGLGINAADDLLAATTIAGAPWTGALDRVSMTTAAYLTTADRSYVIISIDTAALTAGAFTVKIGYLAPNIDGL